MSDADFNQAEETEKREAAQASQGLSILRLPFPDRLISKLPKPTCKNDVYDKLPKAKCAVCNGYHATTNTIHLDYVGHAALTDRLLDADPRWYWEPLAFDDKGLPKFDDTGGLWIRLFVCGHSRLGYGHAANKTWSDIGSREKEVIGDALRNAAMRFGAALDLWHKGDLHEDDEPEQPAANYQVAALRAAAEDRPIEPAYKPISLTSETVRQVISQTLTCLANNDSYGLKEIWDEFDADHRAFLWKKFDSTQRSSIKTLIDSLKK